MNVRCPFECLVLTFIVLSNVSVTSSLKNKKYGLPCTQRGPCQCLFPNGIGVDLTKLANHDFGWVKVNETADIFYHACVDVRVGNESSTNECYAGVSVCLRNLSANNVTSYISLGKASDGKFFSTNSQEPVALNFHKTSRQAVTVNLKCSENPTDLPSLEAKVDNDNYIITLTSPQSCNTNTLSEVLGSGLSGGSILVLMFIVLSATYFGGGMLTLKFLRGAEGKEMIPNYEFWADLPYLVRDGIIYTLSGFQPPPSYDRI